MLLLVIVVVVVFVVSFLCAPSKVDIVVQERITCAAVFDDEIGPKTGAVFAAAVVVIVVAIH